MYYISRYLLVFVLIIGVTPFFGQTVQTTSLYSEALGRTNYANVYLPPGYNIDTEEYYPVIYFLHGYGGSQNSAETIFEIADSLTLNNIINPVIIVCANNSPSPFMGSFFVNSSLNGNYEDYMTEELITWMENNYRVISGKNYRSLMGQSMGGYGCFRYGTEHKDLFRGFAAHGSAINFDLAITDIASEIVSENAPGPPFSYNFSNGLFTQFIFAMSGAFSPNENSEQNYITPQIVDFPMNQNAELIESFYQTFQAFDPVHALNSLTSIDSVAILFGAGRNDNLYLFTPNFAVKDTLDNLGLEYEYFDHNGGHGMPVGFKERALIFLDSIMQAPEETDENPPIATWEMNEGTGTITYNSSGENNNGTLINGPIWTTGKYGYGLSFDGFDDKIDCGNDQSLDFGISDYTITSWVKMGDDQNLYPTILAKGGGASYDEGYWMLYRNNRLWLFISDGEKRVNAYSEILSIDDSEWHHLAAVVDRDDVITFYLDGESAGTFDISLFENIDIRSSKSLTVGIFQNSKNTAFKGAIDNTILYNELLSPAAINTLYSGGTVDNNPPVVLENATASPELVCFPGSTTLSVDANDPDGDELIYSWLKLSGPGYITLSTNNNDEANLTEVSFSETGTYNLRVIVTDGIDSVNSDVSVEVVNIITNSNTLAHWPMDEGEGTTTADISDGSNDGNLVGGPSWETGTMGNAIFFDGVNDKIDCGNDPSLNIGSGDFTLASWVKMDDTQNNYPTIVSKGGGASYDEGYWCFVRGERIRLYISDGITRIGAYSDIVLIDDDLWHHIATVIDRDDVITFYLDGDQVGTYDISEFNGKDISSSKDFTIGAMGTSGTSFYNGLIDDTRLYNEALDVIEIMGVMSGEQGSDPCPLPEGTPVISAAPDTLSLNETAQLSVTTIAENPESFIYSWIKASGPGSATFFPNNNNYSDLSEASFTSDGNYVVRVYVSNGVDSISNDINIVIDSQPDGPIPLAHWPMEEGTGPVTEEVISSTSSILLYNASWTTGISGNGISLDGMQDRINGGNSDDLNIGTSDFTISGWIKMGDNQLIFPTLVGKGGDAPDEEGYWLVTRPDLLRFYVSDGTSQIYFDSDAISIGNNTWYHIAVVIDRDGQIIFYVDGVEAGLKDISPYAGIDITSLKSLSIGANRNNGNSYLNGDIDDCRLYNIALTGDEVFELFDMYSANKSSSANNFTYNQVNDLLLTSFPNPFQDQTNIRFKLNEQQKVTINIFDLNGRLVAKICDRMYIEGIHTISWNGQSTNKDLLKPGLYIVKMNSLSFSEEFTINKLR